MFNPYMNPYGNFAAPMQQEVQTVNGEESAKAFPLPPNSSALLLDANDPLVWLVKTDASGFRTVTPFSITPYTPQKPEDKLESIERRLEKIESCLGYAEPRESSDAAAHTDGGSPKERA